MQPDVTYIVAAYNAEDTIVRAVAGALDQRDVAVQVVVVDDCSGDATLSRLQTFDDPRVVVLRQERNGGPGAARNAGLARAQGRWLAVLDADDTLLPERTARMLERADTQEAEIVLDDLAVVEEDDASTATPSPMFGAYLERLCEISLADFIDGNRMFAGRFSLGYMKPIISRAFVDAHALRYDETLKIGEDYLVLARALAAGARCVVEPRAGYRYHIRGRSLSRVLEIPHLDAMLEADRRFLAGHPLAGEAAAAQRRRTRSLEEARSFLLMVEHIKKREGFRLVRQVWRDPAAARHLKMPIAARLKRFASVRGRPATGMQTLSKENG